MRGSDGDTINALAAAPDKGLAPRQLIWITAQNKGTGVLATFGYWNEHLPVTLNVVSGVDGTIEARTYQADGAVLDVGKIPLTSDISVRTATFKLSMLHPIVRTMMQDYRLKLAAIEIHRVPLDTVSYLPASDPRCRFIGTIDTAQVVVPKTGGAGSVSFSCTSATAELYRSNPAKRGDETQRRRNGDRHMKYADVASQWDDLLWGGAS